MKDVSLMLAVQGYYDGEAIKTFEKISAKPNQRVLITLLDDFVEPVPYSRKKGVRGILSHYANPVLAQKENGAWERAAVEKHDTV